MTIRCLIVDDEPNAVSLLEMLIEQNTSWELVGKCYDAREALAFLKTHPTIDLIFLDINMPQLTGMEMASLLPKDTRIVFTTAYSEFAADSYSFQTIDYLLKPITLKRFYSALFKIETHFNMLEGQSPRPPAAAPSVPAEEYFFIKSGRVLNKVLLKDILYFEGEKEYARLVSINDKILIYKRLKDIEEQLSPSFTRVHNSYIINIARVDSIRDNHIFIGGKQIPISEKFREPFMNIIRERTF